MEIVCNFDIFLFESNFGVSKVLENVLEIGQIHFLKG